MTLLSSFDVSREELLALVDHRRDQVRRYLEWALESERHADLGSPHGQSMRMDRRPDIRAASEATGPFAEAWWGIVVFSCFGCRLGAETVSPRFRNPIPPADAVAALKGIDFPRGSVGHHRIQSTLKGAKTALVSACGNRNLFHDVLHQGGDFDSRYRRLRGAKITQWGRTTCFDLLLRAGALAVGGQSYLPELAYLAGSTGPKKGFDVVFGIALDDDKANWAEGVLHTWTHEWIEVAERVGIKWEGAPLCPRDQENFLCIYQEHIRKSRPGPSALLST